jgi:hypothetical protein
LIREVHLRTARHIYFVEDEHIDMDIGQNIIEKFMNDSLLIHEDLFLVSCYNVLYDGYTLYVSVLAAIL